MTVIPGTHLDDVSEFQSYDWTKYARVRQAAIIRVDYGAWHPDAHWVENHPARVSSGLLAVCGLYDYLVASQDPVQQANAFCDMVGPLYPGEFYALDLEEGFGDQTPRALAWYSVVDRRLGRVGSRRLRWVAAYGVGPTISDDLWQHTNGTDGNHECQPPYPGAPAADCSVTPLGIVDLRKLVEQNNSCIYSYVPFIEAHINLNVLDPGGPAPAPTPSPSGKVPMRHTPPFVVPPVAADLANPGGIGAYTLSTDGSVDNWGGAPYVRGVNGQPFFIGRSPADLAAPNPQEKAAGKTLVVIANTGERYALPV